MTALSPQNHALAKLRANEPVKLYVTGNFATPRHIDFICRSGVFDAIWLDLEHFDLSTQDVAVLNLVARAFPVTMIARFKAADYQTVMRILETGVGGIMCSMVNSAEEARQIVQWAKFNNPNPAPGEVTGARGWNGGNIDGAYATLPALEYIRHQNTQTMIICQIETEAAVAEAAAIAAVPGVDGLFFGPGDYSVAVGRPGQIDHELVRAGMARVAEAAAAAGKWWGTVAVGPAMWERVRGLGARLISPGGDIKVMQYGIRELAKTFGGVPAVSTTPPPAPGGARLGY
ncbi:aldolase/citrate lyase family protein [Opitutus sp. ER46]|uniref:HpcH/HpaI aldolase family protein n=1 Tax=Opitutus sp. ER46 TaxID=2161864 RepID=UPI000D301285|nr:aldolase/citrate lyase family protein [Opitutus sp. ER46]PTX97874.1 aldolase [Opitutus sp. ER46]